MDKESTKDKRRFKAWKKANPESLADNLRTLQECLSLRPSNRLVPVPARTIRRKRTGPPR
jgi:hypothetical protein